MPGPIAHLTTQTHLVTQTNQQGTEGFTMRMEEEEGGGGARRGGRQRQTATKVVTMVDNRGGGKGRVRRRGEGGGVMAPTKGSSDSGIQPRKKKAMGDFGFGQKERGGCAVLGVDAREAEIHRFNERLPKEQGKRPSNAPAVEEEEMENPTVMGNKNGAKKEGVGDQRGRGSREARGRAAVVLRFRYGGGKREEEASERRWEKQRGDVCGTRSMEEPKK